MKRPPEKAHRAGFCAIVGLPNVGKSTLLNRLVGERISIVTPKAQTTRRSLRAIHSSPRGQAIFVDTPGLLEPRYPLQEAMRLEAETARAETDVLLYVVDAGYRASVEAGLEHPTDRGAPTVLSLNKVDRVAGERREELVAAFEDRGWGAVVPTIATRGEGVDRLLDEVLERLPDSPPLYPVDELAAEPVRFFVAEFIREACLEALSEEVPYSVAVVIEEFREGEVPLYISATVYVERDSQKGIVIGKGGRMIRRIGTAARERVEEFLSRRVYLDLRVKVLPKWRKRADELRRLGYRLPATSEG